MNNEDSIIKQLWLPELLKQLNHVPEFLEHWPTPPPPTRLQRLRRRLRFLGPRERLALLLAPWLDRSDDW